MGVSDVISAEIVRERIKELPSDLTNVLDEILEANGHTREIWLQSPEAVTQIEMFMYNFPKMVCLEFFPALTTLQLIQQDISVIEGLDGLERLEKLWIIESRVDNISGLDHLPNLKCLYLYSNNISKIENLDALTALEVLWLADNSIPCIEGLETLKQLRELNLARNCIEQLGDDLRANSNLEVLNLADNPIGSFKEISNLSRLRKLAELCLADPMWGDCPVANLCNYQIYTLFSLPRLTSLDTVMLTDETRQLAEATYMKKSMYYNMRIKTFRRNASDAIRLAAEGKKAKLESLQAPYHQVALLRKDIMQQLEETPDGRVKDMDPITRRQLQDKLEAASSLLQVQYQQVEEVQKAFAEACSRMNHMVDRNVSHMMLELESGGNIRMEEGRPGDAWVQACRDLVCSRFTQGDYQELGVTGIHVTRILRVHNRFLRNRFEAYMADADDGSSEPSKRNCEHLLYGQHPALPGEIERVCEVGFRPAAELASLGLDEAVALSTNVSLADGLRLRTELEEAKGPELASTLTGKLLIVKAFLGSSMQDNCPLGHKRVSPSYNSKGTLQASSLLDGPVITQSHFSGADCVYRMKTSDPRQRKWYLFNHAHALPEYLVEFEYRLGPTSPLLHRIPAMLLPLSGNQAATVTERLDNDMRPYAQPLLYWFTCYFDPASCQAQDSQHTSNQATDRVLAMPPILPAGPKLYIMSKDSLMRHCTTDHLGCLTHLNLHNCSIRRIECLEGMPLKVLILSFNNITRMEGLADLTALTRLDLDYNNITNIECLKGLNSLKHLELQHNQLSEVEDINLLRKHCCQLTYLDLRCNIMTEDKTYPDLVYRRLPALQVLDGEKVSNSNFIHQGEAWGSVTIPLIRQHATTTKRSRLLPVEGVGTSDHEDWLESVEELNLEHCGLRRLQGLQCLPGLRKASFADNHITRIESLETCTTLEVLNLEDNRFNSLDGLVSLTRLCKLEVGRNRVTTLEPISRLVNLSLLSIEDNQIESLSGLENLSRLMELYACNNRITELKDVQRLRELPRLVILDLSGNPLSSSPEYRLYTIYNVRRLKVLDGGTVDASEQAAARNKYAGRLTLDFLEQRIGHRFFHHIRQLDISSLRIRDVGTVFSGHEFEQLQELNLDNNLLTDIGSIANLHQLTVLSMNGNRMGLEANFSLRRMSERTSSDLTAAVRDSCDSPSLSEKSTAELGFLQPYQMPDQFPNLQVLQLGFNQITSIQGLGLSCLTGLRSLFLQGNDIARIDGLDGLTNLHELVLDRNRIRYIDHDSFQGVSQLRVLHMDDNSLRSLVGLQHLQHLQSLHLSCNRISDPMELDRLTALTQLTEINLANNPLARKQVYRAQLFSKCEMLYMADGQPVSQEEKDAIHGNIMLGNTSLAQLIQTLDIPSLAAAAMANGPLDTMGAPMSRMQGGKIAMKLPAVNLDAAAGGSILSGTSSGFGGGSAAGLGLQGIGSLLPFPNSAGSFLGNSGMQSMMPPAPNFGLEGTGIGVRDNGLQDTAVDWNRHLSADTRKASAARMAGGGKDATKTSRRPMLILSRPTGRAGSSQH